MKIIHVFNEWNEVYNITYWINYVIKMILNNQILHHQILVYYS